MTDEETIARLRASEMGPSNFLDALEDLEATQEIPSPEVVAFTEMRNDRDVWRFSCVASWAMWALTLLAATRWGVS